MTSPNDFLTWISNRLHQDPTFNPPWEKDIPKDIISKFDLVLKRNVSVRKARQYHFYKIIPSDLNIEYASQLAYDREIVMNIKSTFFKMIPDYLVFFYVTDKYIPVGILGHLADFNKVRKKIMGNVFQINVLLETEKGTYLSPQKIGIWGWGILSHLKNDIRDTILEPFRVWQQELSY